MSYAFDVLAKAWAQLQGSLPNEVASGELATRFGFMLEELHECDHRLKGQINHDHRISATARALDCCIDKKEKV